MIGIWEMHDLGGLVLAYRLCWLAPGLGRIRYFPAKALAKANIKCHCNSGLSVGAEKISGKVQASAHTPKPARVLCGENCPFGNKKRGGRVWNEDEWDEGKMKADSHMRLVTHSLQYNIHGARVHPIKSRHKFYQVVDKWVAVRLQRQFGDFFVGTYGCVLNLSYFAAIGILLFAQLLSISLLVCRTSKTHSPRYFFFTSSYHPPHSLILRRNSVLQRRSRS